MLPEYHLFLLCILFFAGLPGYSLAWVRRRRKARAGQGTRPSRAVLLFYLFTGAVFLRHLVIFGPFPMRARQFEAKQNLGAVYYRQREYHAAHGEFAGGQRAFALLEYHPTWPPERYALFCGDDVFGPKPEWMKSGPATWPLRQVPDSSATGYTCVAVGNIDWDGWPDVWTMNDAKKLSHSPTDLWEPEPEEFDGHGLLFPDHPFLSRLDPGGFYYDSLSVSVLLPVLLICLIAWDEWRRKATAQSEKPKQMI